MKKKFKFCITKDIIIFWVASLLSLVFVLGMNNYILSSYSFFKEDDQNVIVEARVISIFETYEEENYIGGSNYYTPFDAEILMGALKGHVVSSTQVYDVFMAHEPIELEVGDKVLLFLSEIVDGEDEWLYGDIIRIDGIYMLAGFFFALLLLMGGFKGVRTIFSLTLTCMAVFLVLIPAILAGMNIYEWSIIISAFIIVMTIVVANGISKKSFVAAIGCFSGSAVCGILTIFMAQALKLTGAVDEESLFLVMLNPDKPIDLNGVIFAAILIGGVGAIMDVAISLSSSLYEVWGQNHNITPMALMKSGMTIGKDIMGTMANTLVLAYIGSSLSVVVLLVAYNSSLNVILNRELIITEILQALAGSIGILLTIPLTSFVCTLVYISRKDTKGQDEENQQELNKQ